MNDIHSILSVIDRKQPPADLRRRILHACEADEPVEELDCEQILELASAYLDGELHGHERNAFEAHVFVCGECYAAFKSMERTAEVLRETPHAVAPADLHERISAAVARDAASASVFTWRRAAKVLGGLTAAAALFAAVVMPRAGGGVDVDAPVIAEAQPTIQSNLTDPAEPVRLAEPDVALDEAAEEPAAMETPGEAVVVATPAPARARSAAPTVRSTEPRTPAARETPTAVRPMTVASEHVRTPAPQPRPERATSSPRRTTESARAPEHTTGQPASEPVVADDRAVPAPAHERTPQVVPEPPTREPQPRETVVATTPRDREPEPAAASAATPHPVAAISAPQPRPERATTRLSVVPQQRPSSTVYQPRPTPAAEQSERLSRMAAGINNAQNPRMDNPRSGIQIN